MSEDWARPVVHWEIVGRDPGRLAEFYRRLFNWEIGDGPLMGVAPGQGGPVPGPAGHLRQGDPGGVHLFVQVRDLRASLTLAAELGGTVAVEPFDTPNGPTIAAIDDPEGNRMMLVQQ